MFTTWSARSRLCCPLPLCATSEGYFNTQRHAGYFNSGFMLLRHTAAMRSFALAYLRELRQRRSANDQGVLNDVLGIGEGSESAARHRALDR